MRLFVAVPLAADTEIDLPPGATRHAQVRRVQPGQALTLFDGSGLDFAAEVLAMGRSSVRVRVAQPSPVDRELPFAVTLAVGMPANDRMDALVEKATELGVASIQPLITERSVLRLDGERAERRRAHWQGVAVAACEQCGRARVPHIAAVQSLGDWLAQAPEADVKLMLSFAADARPLPAVSSGPRVTVVSGPEGGLTADEEAAARDRSFVATTLGPRVLRADTAPVAVLAALGLQRPA